MPTETTRPPKRIKIITMGDPFTGKSCLIKRYCEKRFIPKYYQTIGIDYGVIKASIRNQEVKVNIFDMAGDMVYYEVRNEFYKDTDGALLVFDIGSHESFQALDRWTQEMKTELRKYNSSSPLKVCVCGNKSLLESIIEPDFARGGSFDGLRGVHSDTTFPPFVPKKGNVSSSYGNSEEVPVTTDYPVSSPKRSVRSRSPPSARECQFTAKPCYTPQQLNAVNRIRNATNNHERLGVALWASRDEINRAYRRLAFTVHPDKNFAPGSEEAFKLLVAARTTLLQSILPFTGYKFRTHQ